MPEAAKTAFTKGEKRGGRNEPPVATIDIDVWGSGGGGGKGVRGIAAGVEPHPWALVADSANWESNPHDVSRSNMS